MSSGRPQPFDPLHPTTFAKMSEALHLAGDIYALGDVDGFLIRIVAADEENQRLTRSIDTAAAVIKEPWMKEFTEYAKEFLQANPEQISQQAVDKIVSYFPQLHKFFDLLAEKNTNENDNIDNAYKNLSHLKEEFDERKQKISEIKLLAEQAGCLGAIQHAIDDVEASLNLVEANYKTVALNYNDITDYFKVYLNTIPTQLAVFRQSIIDQVHLFELHNHPSYNHPRRLDAAIEQQISQIISFTSPNNHRTNENFPRPTSIVPASTNPEISAMVSSISDAYEQFLAKRNTQVMPAQPEPTPPSPEPSAPPLYVAEAPHTPLPAAAGISPAEKQEDKKTNVKTRAEEMFEMAQQKIDAGLDLIGGEALIWLSFKHPDYFKAKTIEEGDEYLRAHHLTMIDTLKENKAKSAAQANSNKASPAAPSSQTQDKPKPSSAALYQPAKEDNKDNKIVIPPQEKKKKPCCAIM